MPYSAPYTVESSFFIPGNYEDPPETVIVDSIQYDSPQEALEGYYDLIDSYEDAGQYKR